MQLLIIKIKTILKDKRYVSLISFLVADLALIGLLIFIGFKIFASYTDFNSIKSSNEGLKSQVDLITKNKALLATNISRYNLILDDLIPDKETYFQVIAALEKLQTNTGVLIDSYSINLESTTEDKLSLALSISGSRENLNKLYKDHKFVSRRLITNESMSANFDETDLTYDVNLYHDLDPGAGGSPDVEITDADLKLLEQVASSQE